MKKLVSLFLAFSLLTACLPALASSNYSDLIVSVLDALAENDKSVSGAPQQTANGAYRAVEMLAIMAYRLDTSGAYSSIIESFLKYTESKQQNAERRAAANRQRPLPLH